MNRRDFLATGLGTVVAGAAAEGVLIAAEPAADAAPAGGASDAAIHPRDIKLCVKPVMANLIHTGEWQGPCRWTSVPPDVERAQAERWFAEWSKQLKTKGLGRAEDVRLLEPVHVTFSQDWVLRPEQIAKLAPDARETDVYFMYPSGNSRSSYEIGNMFARPILLNGLGCRNTDIAALILAKGNEAFVAGEDIDLTKMLSLLRARKVFRLTTVLYPTNGVAPFSVGNVWDFEGLRKRLGVTVKNIKYDEMAGEMNRLLGDRAAGQRAEHDAAELFRKADKSFIAQPLVVRNMLFDQCIRNLMARHGCNSFTIDCFEFCPSLLPQKWMGRKIFPLKQEAGLDVDYLWQIPQVEYWLKELKDKKVGDKDE